MPSSWAVYNFCHCRCNVNFLFSLQDKRRLEETIAELLQDNERMHNDLSRSPYRPPSHLQLPGTSLRGTAVLRLGCGLQCCRQQRSGPCILASGGGTCRPHLTLQPTGPLTIVAL